MRSITFTIVDSRFKNEVYTRFLRLFCEIVVPVSQVDTRNDGPCPMESIHQHSTPSVNASVYFSKSLDRDRTSAQSNRHKESRVVSVRIRLSRSANAVNASVYFSKSLAIGLPLSRTDTKRDGSCLSVSD